METQVLVPVLSTICIVTTVIIGFLTFNRNRDKDVRTDASKSAVIETKLDAISQGVDLIRIDIKANENRVSDLTEKVIRIDESNKQAHKRIDSLINKIDYIEN